MKHFSIEYWLMLEMVIPFMLGYEAGLLSSQFDSCLVAAALLAACNVSYRQHSEGAGPRLRRYGFMAAYTIGALSVLCIQALWLSRHDAWKYSLFGDGMILLLLILVACITLGRTISWGLDIILHRTIVKDTLPFE